MRAGHRTALRLPPLQTLLTKGNSSTPKRPESGAAAFEEALKQFRSDHDRHGEAVVLGYIANCQRKLGNLDEALQFAQHALRMKEELGDRGEQGNTHNQLGLIEWERADYPAAIQHLRLAIEIGASIGDEELQGSAHNNLGLVLDERGDYQHSLEQYQLALKFDRAAYFERGEGDALGNVGGVHLTLGRFREALPFYQQALRLANGWA